MSSSAQARLETAHDAGVARTASVEFDKRVAWTNVAPMAPGEPCRGCEHERRFGRPCSLHGADRRVG
jgi:hypothetical protein